MEAIPIKQKPAPEEVRKIERTSSTHTVRKAQQIDLYFGDESGFSLTPYIPYGWQPIGEQLSIDTQRKHITNILGILDPIDNVLYPYYTRKGEMINTEFMIRAIEDFL